MVPTEIDLGPQVFIEFVFEADRFVASDRFTAEGFPDHAIAERDGA
jgi:hypothetical protein